MCVYKYTCAVPLLLHLVTVLCLCERVCAEEGSEEKINEEGTSTSILCLAHVPSLTLNVGAVRKYERKRLSLYIIPQAGLHLPSVYIRGVRISKELCIHNHKQLMKNKPAVVLMYNTARNITKSISVNITKL